MCVKGSSIPSSKQQCRGEATPSPPQSQQWPHCPCFLPHLQSHNCLSDTRTHTHVRTHTDPDSCVYTLWVCGNFLLTSAQSHKHHTRPQTLDWIDGWSYGSFHAICVSLNGRVQSGRLNLTGAVCRKNQKTTTFFVRLKVDLFVGVLTAELLFFLVDLYNPTKTFPAKI